MGVVEPLMVVARELLAVKLKKRLIYLLKTIGDPMVFFIFEKR